jgi:hypothetical protein
VEGAEVGFGVTKSHGILSNLSCTS